MERRNRAIFSASDVPSVSAGLAAGDSLGRCPAGAARTHDDHFLNALCTFLRQRCRHGNGRGKQGTDERDSRQ